jgi:hypothetical protein
LRLDLWLHALPDPKIWSSKITLDVIPNSPADLVIDGSCVKQQQQLLLLNDATSGEFTIEHDVFLTSRYVFGDCQVVRI